MGRGTTLGAGISYPNVILKIPANPVPANMSGKSADHGPNTGSLQPTQETQMDFLASGFSLAQQCICGVNPHMEMFFVLTFCLILTFSAFQINK